MLAFASRLASAGFASDRFAFACSPIAFFSGACGGSGFRNSAQQSAMSATDTPKGSAIAARKSPSGIEKRS